ncbi:hypothetical protein GUJ93_ZPchr0002g25765 [Zizania palustris]|uniref:No apical meristem-associated C-terminal domain-containing protein n=1 Tax=Zizania palustris TaxID=103762 RepID=A0A8J5S7B3_ZIZPA|nr:hypothetical protein GUJ93_ZPchr0002g25765 [Zizania palustris]
MRRFVRAMTVKGKGGEAEERVDNHSFALKAREASVNFSIDDAVKIYEKDEPFLFMHCWKLLHNEAKWNDKVLELNTSGAAVKGTDTSQAPSVEIHSRQDKSEEPRPESRDSAKRKRARGLGDASKTRTADERDINSER